MDSIRNFCIIAHIDHGKSTLADRLLEITGAVQPRQMRAQLLDTMDLERERGITIKLQPVRMSWRGYTLNLIDTPGHADFSYEVSRSLAACEGALLIVDAAQGVQAQTLNNVYLALEASLKIVPVINKIDLPAANVERAVGEISKLLGCDPSEILKVSAKTGEGVEGLLAAIVERIPSPQGQSDKPPRALVFDSKYDEYRGVELYVRVVDGGISKDQAIELMGSQASGTTLEVGHFSPQLVADKTLETGQIGYIITNLKSLEQAKTGDTVTIKSQPATQPLPGYREVRPFVFAGVFPTSAEQFQDLKDAIEKLKLNDAALQYEPESSTVLGSGFRAGFLGLLHLEIVRERLEREYGLDLVVTTPSTEYQVELTDGQTIGIRNAADLPEPTLIKHIKEPRIKGEIVFPKQFMGKVVGLINNTRGRHHQTKYLDESLAIVEFEAPLAKILTDFYDRLKSLTSGYGSLSYELIEPQLSDLVKLSVLVAGENVPSLSAMVHRDEASSLARSLLARLKETIPRQLFEISLQAAVGNKVIAREDIKPLGKNVTAHLYGGDITRKRKLWEKQKAGKRRMKKVGKVDIPPEAFTALLKKD